MPARATTPRPGPALPPRLPVARAVSPPSSGEIRRAQRSCGPCDACCVAPSIRDLHKPIDTPCPHLKHGPAGCCSIYEARPDVCRSFLCGWRLGMGGQDDRPDQIGVLMQPTHGARNSPLIAFVEIRPGALDSPRVRELMTQWAAATDAPVTVRRAGCPDFLRVPLTIGGKAAA